MYLVGKFNRKLIYSIIQKSYTFLVNFFVILISVNCYYYYSIAVVSVPMADAVHTLHSGYDD